ncbi:hypothetical protein ACSZNP_04080 [Aeromonas hydrophila]
MPSAAPAPPAGTGPLAGQHIEPPEHPGAERQCRPQGIEGLFGRPQRQQQQQADDGQRQPEEVCPMARAEQRHRQGADELDGQRHAEGDPLDRQIEKQIHCSQRQPIGDGPQQGASIEGHSPDPKHQREEQGGASQSEQGGTGGPDQGKQGLGQRGAEGNRQHGEDDRQQGGESSGVRRHLVQT